MFGQPAQNYRLVRQCSNQLLRNRKLGYSAFQDNDKSKSQKGGGGLGGLFGGRSKASADAPTGPQKQKKIDSKLVDAKPAGKEVCCSSLLHLITVTLSVRLSTAVWTACSSETWCEPFHDNTGAYVAQACVAVKQI